MVKWLGARTKTAADGLREQARTRSGLTVNYAGI
jgi:hypothetical protein